MYSRVLLPLLAAMLGGVASHRIYMTRVPNSHHVISPCDTPVHWSGLGHQHPLGGGPRSQFGIDFLSNNLQWTEDMCKKDSDRDGRTNGEELGDPNCAWSPGNDVILDTSSVTHPGICEPLDSADCMVLNDWLSCDAFEDCPGIHQPDVQNLTFRFPDQAVPIKKTSHTCMIVEFPQDGDYHIVATKPFIDNTKVLHHAVIYGCSTDREPEHAVNEPYECGLLFDHACQDIFFLWILGIPGKCLHENTGFRIGTHGYKRAGLQLHWENQELSPSARDSSGMTIFYTSQTRMYDAGVIWIGTSFMEIPPGEKSHEETGACYGDCTSRRMTQNVYVTLAMNHMHYLGRSMRIDHLRGNRTVNVITDEPQYNYDSQKLFYFQEPLEVRPGDELRTTCVYDSTSRDTTTMFGEGYHQEMCFGFLTYYPKQAFDAADSDSNCLSWKTVPACQFYLDTEIEGCDFVNVHNLADTGTKRVYDDVMKHCRPLAPCYKDCLPVVNRIQKLPCYHGNMWRWQRETLLSSGSMSDEARVTWFKFYAAFDSCAAALDDEASPVPSSTWSPYNTSHGALVVALLTCYSVLYN